MPQGLKTGGNERIQKFDSDGNFISKCGENFLQGGQFSSPSGIAVDQSGNIYIADFGILVFSPY
jgi:hypothetical protein